MIWSDALKQVWSAHQTEQLEYGVMDCCQFVREYVALLICKDYGETFSYTTEAEANAIMDEHGGLVGLLTSILGEPKDDPQPGDIVVVHIPNALAAAVYCGDWVIGFIPDKGLRRYRASIVRAWSCQQQ